MKEKLITFIKKRNQINLHIPNTKIKIKTVKEKFITLMDKRNQIKCTIPKHKNKDKNKDEEMVICCIPLIFIFKPDDIRTNNLTPITSEQITEHP